jgi:hypothetical protein
VRNNGTESGGKQLSASRDSRDLGATAFVLGAFRHRRIREHLVKGAPPTAFGARRAAAVVRRGHAALGIWVLVVFGLDPDTRRLPEAACE